MKRLFLLAVLFAATAICASAQYTAYYCIPDENGVEPEAYWFQIDWENKLFFVDGDSENDGPIKNYKESGNTRTFDVYYPPTSGIKDKLYSVKFVTEEGGYYRIHLTTHGGVQMSCKLTTTKPSRGGGDDDNSINGKINAKAQSIKDAIGKGVSKGLDALKNKEKNKDKSEKKTDDEK